MDSKIWDLLERHVKEGDYCSYCVDPESGYDGAACPWPCDTAELLTRFGYETREIPLYQHPAPGPAVVDPSVHIVTVEVPTQIADMFLLPGDSIFLHHDLGPDHDHVSCDIAELVAQLEREIGD